MIKKYNRYNFFKHTFCEWKSVADTPKQEVDYISKSGSSYFFTADGVYRVANHWGRAANCRWRILSNAKASQINQIGYANWVDFYPNNDIDLLYFIEINWETRMARYQHKFADRLGTNTYRSSISTVKRIQLINTVLESGVWAKYMVYDDLEALTRFVVERLTGTNQSILQIKREWANGKKK